MSLSTFMIWCTLSLPTQCPKKIPADLLQKAISVALAYPASISPAAKLHIYVLKYMPLQHCKLPSYSIFHRTPHNYYPRYCQYILTQDTNNNSSRENYWEKNRKIYFLPPLYLSIFTNHCFSISRFKWNSGLQPNWKIIFYFLCTRASSSATF